MYKYYQGFLNDLKLPISNNLLNNKLKREALRKRREYYKKSHNNKHPNEKHGWLKCQEQKIQMIPSLRA